MASDYNLTEVNVVAGPHPLGPKEIDAGLLVSLGKAYLLMTASDYW